MDFVRYKKDKKKQLFFYFFLHYNFKTKKFRLFQNENPIETLTNYHKTKPKPEIPLRAIWDEWKWFGKYLIIR